MELTSTSTPDTSVYINDNYVTLAASATAVRVNLAPGVSFNTTPSLATLGLTYDQLNEPQGIEGDPTVGTAISFDVNGDDGLETITVEAIEPTFTIVQGTGSALVTITDTMSIDNPALDGRGRIVYEIQIDDTWVELGAVSRGNAVQFSACDYDFGTYDVRATYTVRLIPNCGGTSPIVFTAEYEDEVTLVEWRPELTLAYENAASCSGACCGAVEGIEVTVTPTFDTNIDTGESTLTYRLVDYNDEIVGSDEVIIIDNTDPGAAVVDYVFTPDAKGDFKVQAWLNNGYATCYQEVIIASCDYLTLEQIVGSCGSYDLSNCSLATDHTYTVIDSEDAVVGTANTNLLAGASATIVLDDDGVYRVTIYNNDDSVAGAFVIIKDCDILDCLTTKFNGILCNPKDCECVDHDKERYDLTRILPTAYLFYNYMHREYALNALYSALDDAKLIELQSIQNTVEKLQAFCDNCGTDDSSDCGC
jgi:hypothetical protein